MELVRRQVTRQEYREYKLVSIEEVTGLGVAQITLRRPEGQLIMPKNDKTLLVHIAAQITARARAYMMSNLYRLHRDISPGGGEIIYMDTDSLVFSNPINLPVTLNIHPSDLGAFKHEYPPGAITRFRAIAPKMYAMRVDDKTIYKAKGLSLKNELDLIAKLFDELENWEAPRWR